MLKKNGIFHMLRVHSGAILLSSAILLTTTLVFAGDGKYEVKIDWVNLFDGEGECGGTDLDWMDNIAAGAEDGFETINYDVVYKTGNKAVDAKDYYDHERDDDGQDHVYPVATDWADVAFLATHGGYKCSETVAYSKFLMGEEDPVLGCRVYTNRTNEEGDIYFGNESKGYYGDLDVFVSFSCHSGQECVYDSNVATRTPVPIGGGYSGVDGPEFKMWNGFHGYNWERGSMHNKAENYVENSTTSGIGSHFIDYFFDEDGYSDVCPVSIVWGQYYSDRYNFYKYAGFKDIFSTGTNAQTSYWYVEGCDPEGGPRMGYPCYSGQTLCGDIDIQGFAVCCESGQLCCNEMTYDYCTWNDECM